MNKLKSLLTWMLLLVVSHVMGINVTVDPIEIEAGKAAQLVINLSNTETNLTAYQMFLYLPNGVTVQKKSNGKYTYTINNNRHDGAFTISVKDAEGGSVLITCFSADKDVITGTSGELIRLPLEVASTVTTSLQGSLKNIEFSDVNAKAYKPADVTFNMTLKAPVEPVTITADNKTMTYGDDVPTLTYKSSGAKLNGMPKLSTTATKTSPVGTYPIKVEKGTVTNEQVTYVDGTLTISKASLTVGVQNVTITEGDAIPAFTLTYSGFKNGDTEANAFSTKPTATTTATSSSKAGTYPITVSGGSAKNYTLTYQQGTLTIMKKESTSTWTNIIVNSDLEGNDVSCFYKRENYAENETVIAATIGSHSGKGSSRGIAVKSVDNAADAWNTQFFVRLPQTIPTGTKYRLSFDYKASREAYVLMEIHAEPSEYIFYDFDHMTFTPSWQHYESEGTITGEMSPEENKMRTIAFDLAHEKTATAYYFDNIIFEIEESQVEQPVIITANDQTMIYGDDVPTLTYKSSGAKLNGTPKLSTTATKTSPVGTYPIKVEKGTVTNEAVTYVDGTLTISKAPLTVGVQNVTITEGDAIPAFTLTYSGFRNGDTESKAFTTKPTATTTATSSSKAGTYPITVSGGSATNYALTYTQGTLTIQKKSVEPVTITADNKTMTYGDDVPTLTYKSSGAKLNGTPKLSTTATKTSPVGTYPIKVEKGTVTNEAVTYVDGTLTISKAPLTVGVQNVTITEGDAIPAFTLTYSGFRNGDTESKAFTTKPTAATTATSSSKAGTYPITVSGGSAKNYTLTYQQGTLTIKEKESTSTWTNIVVNSDLEGNDVSCFYKRENYTENETVVSATIGSHLGKGSSRGIAVKSVDNASDNWNTQFFVRLPQTIPARTKYRLSFDYRASREAYVLMEIHAEPSEYIYYGFDNMTFTPSWQHYESEGTITGEMSPDENKMRTIAFDLAHEKTATTYYFDNIVFEIPSTSAINTVYADYRRSTAVYNLSGQRLSQPQKGINIINGKKVVVK